MHLAAPPSSLFDFTETSVRLPRNPQASHRSRRVTSRYGARPSYICLLDIPPLFQDEFRTVLRGSACPLIDGAGEYAWASDWADWLEGRFPHG